MLYKPGWKKVQTTWTLTCLLWEDISCTGFLELISPPLARRISSLPWTKLLVWGPAAMLMSSVATLVSDTDSTRHIVNYKKKKEKWITGAVLQEPPVWGEIDVTADFVFVMLKLCSSTAPIYLFSEPCFTEVDRRGKGGCNRHSNKLVCLNGMSAENAYKSIVISRHGIQWMAIDFFEPDPLNLFTTNTCVCIYLHNHLHEGRFQITVMRIFSEREEILVFN